MEPVQLGRRRGNTYLSGVVAIDKPEGWTSHDVIAVVRGATGEGRVGHSGTLDPMATGLMIVLVGPATRLADRIESQEKAYRATVTFGSETDTDDRMGRVTRTAAVSPELFCSEAVRSYVAALVGKGEQVPPAYSAIKVDGVRSYAAARRGEDVLLPARPYEVFRAEVVSIDEDRSSVTVDLWVSKGTYIRAIARDLGRTLGTAAHLSDLRRLSVGSLGIESAISIDTVRSVSSVPGGISTYFIDPVKLLRLPTVVVSDSDVADGRPVSRPGLAELNGLVAHESVAMCTVDSRLLAIYRISADEARLVPETVFPRGVLPGNLGEAVVAIGVFDGVHIGHQKVLGTCVAQARSRGVAAVAVTFDPAPTAKSSGKNGGRPLAPLTSVLQRAELMKCLGVDHVVVIPFDANLGDTSAENFVSSVLAARVVPQCFVVGDDFRFGAGGEGTVHTLSAHADTVSVDLAHMGSQPVSSTAVRAALATGDLATAARLLGRPVSVAGIVESGTQIGREIGAPTANLSYEPPVGALRHGVYVGTARIATCRDTVGVVQYPAAVFVGRPRLDDVRQPLLEAHLIGFEGDLYGMRLVIELHSFVRDVIRFESREELAEAIRNDIRHILEEWESSVSGAYPCE